MTWKTYVTLIKPTKPGLGSCITSSLGCRHERTDATNRYAMKMETEGNAAIGNASVRRMIVGSCVLSLFCLCGVFAGLTLAYLALRDSSGMNAHEKVCMPCAQVMSNPAMGTTGTTDALLDTLEVRRSEEEDGTEKECCAHSPAQYAALFKLLKEAWCAETLKAAQTQVHDTGNSSSAGVSAHLSLKPPVLSRAVNILQWKSASESPRSFVRSGLFHANNQTTLFVITPGLYFVYSQVLYNPDYTNNSSSVVSAYVMRHSPVYPGTSGVLLKSRHTRYNTQTDQHSSYVGGLVALRKGDQLYVLVSKPAAVSHDDSATFFGMFRVGN